MISSIFLQNFRSYTKSEFAFDPKLTIIVGPNTTGKTNLIESLFLVATGKSFRTEKEEELVYFDEDFARIKAQILPISTPIKSGSNTTNTTNENIELEIVFSTGVLEGKSPSKRYFVNSVARRKADFVGHFPVVLFLPIDLDIIGGSPGIRRQFLDNALEQSDREYRLATGEYAKALRQRNALLDRAKEARVRDTKQFIYWDELLIQAGSEIHKKRGLFLDFVNSANHDIFKLKAVYDHSIVSRERLNQYADAEIGAGITLVGPHRDNVLFFMDGSTGSPQAAQSREIRMYGSRGQQRLAVLQLKLMQLLYLEKQLGEKPTLLLDDIFSELDAGHINLVLDMVGNQQTVITTTHEEFIPAKLTKSATMVELKEQ